MNTPIRVALADDHKLVRSGMVSILNADPQLQVVLDVADGRELLDGLAESKPDVVLLDLEMPVLSGRETLIELRKVNADVPVLILTMHDTNALIFQMMELGANGYLVKTTEPEEVIQAIHKVYKDDYYLSERVSHAMLRGIANPGLTAIPKFQAHDLTRREVDVLRLICQEKTTPEIGEALFLSPKTIEGYRKTLFEKVGARNMAGLVLFAVQHNLLEHS